MVNIFYILCQYGNILFRGDLSVTFEFWLFITNIIFYVLEIHSNINFYIYQAITKVVYRFSIKSIASTVVHERWCIDHIGSLTQLNSLLTLFFSSFTSNLISGALNIPTSLVSILLGIAIVPCSIRFVVRRALCFCRSSSVACEVCIYYY